MKILFGILLFPLLIIVGIIMLIATFLLRCIGWKDATPTWKWWKEFFQKSSEYEPLRYSPKTGWPYNHDTAYDPWEDPDWYPGKGPERKKRILAQKNQPWLWDTPYPEEDDDESNIFD